MSALWFIEFSIVWTALLYAGAHLLCRGWVPARFAHNVWRGVAMFSVLPWLLLGLYQLLPAPVAAPIQTLPYFTDIVTNLTNSDALAVSEGPASDLSLGFLLWALLIAGWAVRAGLNLLSQIRLQRIKRSAHFAPALCAETFAKQLGLRRAPRIAIRGNGSPFLAGIRERTIYLPEAFSDAQTADFIIAHECTHLARGDLITRPIERFIAELFWFSPFAWITRRQLDYWREAACDAQTLDLTGNSVGYARVLAKTARLTRAAPRLQGLPVAAFIPNRKAPLKRRLKHILEPAQPQKRRTLTAMACLGGILLSPLSLAQISSYTDSDAAFSHPLVISPEARIAAAFGKTNYYGEHMWHAGVDIFAPTNACVHAPANAVVISTKHNDSYGRMLDIVLEDGRMMRFANLNAINVKKGAQLKAGEVIGTVGISAAGVTKPHLHFEMSVHGEYVDPQTIEGLTLFEG
ncbi:MAG: hypothetical protein Hens3KO_25470 [Henriciella sp.]